MEKPLKVEEAAEFLSLAKTYVYQLVRMGKLTAFNPGGKRLYFRQEDLEKYILKGKRASSEELMALADSILNKKG
jgi:excisionase family DNA binding protein